LLPHFKFCKIPATELNACIRSAAYELMPVFPDSYPNQLCTLLKFQKVQISCNVEHSILQKPNVCIVYVISGAAIALVLLEAQCDVGRISFSDYWQSVMRSTILFAVAVFSIPTGKTRAHLVAV
jgi:hypothetical protein